MSIESESEDPQAALQQMTAMILGYWVSQTIRAVADLSIADHLAVRDLTAKDIAQLEGSAPDTTLRLMRAGVTLGLFTSRADEHYGGTPLLQTLRSDHPSTLRPMALSFTGREYWLPWNEFVAAIRQGSTRIQPRLTQTSSATTNVIPLRHRNFQTPCEA